MKKPLAFLCFLVCIVTFSTAQTKKSSSTPTAAAAGKLCDKHWELEQAEGWPEAPVYILFHREESKAPWARKATIKAAGLESATLGTAKSLVCIEESLIESGKYDSGAKGYSPSWKAYFISLPDRKLYTLSGSFEGGEPPAMKFNAGAGIGKAPVDEFVQWLRSAVGQKVARFKMQFKTKESYDVSAIAFSWDGSKLVIAQEPTHYSSQPDAPTPITVFDLTTGKPTASFTVGYTVHKIALSNAGNLVAIDSYGTPEIWDVASGKLAHKLPSLGFLALESLEFGPNDELAVAGKGQAALWNVAKESKLRSASGSRLLYSSTGAWLLGTSNSDGVTVTEMGSGAAIGTFHFRADQGSYAISRDGKAVLKQSGLESSVLQAGNPDARFVSMGNTGSYLGLSVVAPAPDGFVIANDKGFVGILSESSPEPRVFVATQDWIKALSTSIDGKLVAVGGSGSVGIWQLP